MKKWIRDTIDLAWCITYVLVAMLVAIICLIGKVFKYIFKGFEFVTHYGVKLLAIIDKKQLYEETKD